MYKKVLISLIIITCSFNYSSYAQNAGNGLLKRFGFMAGANICNMNFNKGVPAPPAPIASSWKTGITLGFLLSIPLTTHLFLQPEYSYTQRKGEDKSNETTYSNDYLSLPVLLNYKISPRLVIFAGPQVELLIHAKESSAGIVSNITHDVEERNIGAVAGVEFNVYQSLFISARYLQGFNHIGIGQRATPKEFKYEVASLTAGIRF